MNAGLRTSQLAGPTEGIIRVTHKVALASHLWLSRPGGDILVIKRAGSPYLDGYWSIPAGHVDEGESAVAACVRETREEVGIELSKAEVTFWLVQQKTAADGEERVDFFFEAVLPGGQDPRRASPSEVAEFMWTAPSELPHPFAPYVESAMAARERRESYSDWGFGE